MWYFSWILGIGVALGFGIINVMWLEANEKLAHDPAPGQANAPTNAQSGTQANANATAASQVSRG